MELTWGLILLAILAVATGLGFWAKRHPAPTASDDSGISEREWMDAIK